MAVASSIFQPTFSNTVSGIYPYMSTTATTTATTTSTATAQTLWISSIGGGSMSAVRGLSNWEEAEAAYPGNPRGLHLPFKRIARRQKLRLAELLDKDACAARVVPMPDVVDAFVIENGKVYAMPDGALIKVDERGNYYVEDSEAKVLYRANRVREFNPYINASDQLEKFIAEVGQLDGVEQNEVLRLPIEAFINWLILQAASRDGDPLDGLPSVEAALPKPPPPLPLLPPPAGRTQHRCVACGRFLVESWRAAQVAFCSPAHFERHLLRLTQGDHHALV